MSYTPAFRNYLAALRPGDIAEYLYLTHTVGRGSDLTEAIDDGYLRQIPGDGSWAKYERTEKPCKPWKPKRATGLWPWHLPEHWERVQRAPIRQARAIAMKLHNHALSPWEFPTIVGTKSELSTVRSTLENALMKGTSVYSEFRPYTTTGLGLRLLCLDVLCEPELNDAQVVRFRPIEPERAMEEQQTLYMLGGSPLERYQQFLERANG
jgi:hypothetical protein